VVLADAEDVEADLVGQRDLLQQVAQPPRRIDLGSDVGEGVEAEFHLRFLSARICLRTTSPTSAGRATAPARPILAIETLVKRYHGLPEMWFAAAGSAAEVAVEPPPHIRTSPEVALGTPHRRE
jgi:hypothetical protein